MAPMGADDESVGAGDGDGRGMGEGDGCGCGEALGLGGAGEGAVLDGEGAGAGEGGAAGEGALLVGDGAAAGGLALCGLGAALGLAGAGAGLGGCAAGLGGLDGLGTDGGGTGPRSGSSTPCAARRAGKSSENSACRLGCVGHPVSTLVLMVCTRVWRVVVLRRHGMASCAGDGACHSEQSARVRHRSQHSCQVSTMTVSTTLALY